MWWLRHACPSLGQPGTLEEQRTATATAPPDMAQNGLEPGKGVISSKQPGCAGFHLWAFCTVTRSSLPLDILLTKLSTLFSPPSPKAKPSWVSCYPSGYSLVFFSTYPRTPPQPLFMLLLLDLSTWAYFLLIDFTCLLQIPPSIEAVLVSFVFRCPACPQTWMAQNRMH